MLAQQFFELVVSLDTKRVLSGTKSDFLFALFNNARSQTKRILKSIKNKTKFYIKKTSV